jgi:hypothetical protein
MIARPGRTLGRSLAMLLLALGAMLLVLAPARVARAAMPQMEVNVEPDVIGAGDTVQLQMSVRVSGGEQPDDPRLSSTGGLHQVGQAHISTSSAVTIVNGRRQDSVGVDVVWVLRADRPGTYTVGPPTITVGNHRYAGRAVQVHVVPAGHAPPRNIDPFSGQGQLDPFQSLQNLLQQGMMDPPPPEQLSVPQTDPKLALDSARGRTAFLHATLDKTQAVLGEQLTLSVYLYVDASIGREPPANDVHEVNAADFLKKSLQDDENSTEIVGTAMVEGRPWVVKLVRRSALFPLRTGDLTIGPMSLALVRNGSSVGSQRESETLHVRVTEPPVNGRPPGYVMGDVGHFALDVHVDPRTIERDGAVGVEVDLTGSGNLPAMLPVPARTDVEWLSPTTHEKLGRLDGNKFGGSRHFSYVVKLHKEGDLDLGEIAMPYWDPDARTYAYARAPLGTVKVTPGATAKSSTRDDADLPLANLPAPRATLAGLPPARSFVTDKPLFWFSLLGAPLVVLAGLGATSLGGNLRKKRADQAASPMADWKEKVDRADKASRDVDARAADAATLRALHAAPQAFFGMSIRAAQSSADIVGALVKAGVKDDVAERYAEVVRACEVDRYAPEPASVETVRARWTLAKRLMNELRS